MSGNVQDYPTPIYLSVKARQDGSRSAKGICPHCKKELYYHRYHNTRPKFQCPRCSGELWPVIWRVITNE